MLSSCGRFAFALRANSRSRIEHRFHNLVITGASAQVPGQRVANVVLGRFRIAIEQRLRRNQESGRADAALQGRVLEKLVLQNAKHAVGGESLDGRDVLALSFDAEHQARAYRAALDQHGASAAIAGQASFLGAGELEHVAQCFEQALARLAQELDRFAVNRRFYQGLFGHCFIYRLCLLDVIQFFFARSAAIESTRRVSTAAMWSRNSAVPRMSSIGELAARPAAARAASSSFIPMIASAALLARIGVGPTAASAIRAAFTLSPSSVTAAPTPTTAISISLRGMKRRYASLECGAGAGTSSSTSNSPGLSTVRPGDTTKASTGTSRSPLGPTIRARAPSTIRAGVVSAAGDPLHRLPPTDARF